MEGDRGLIFRSILIASAVICSLLSSSLAAQDALLPQGELEQKLERLESELAELRTRISGLSSQAHDEELDAREMVTIDGDIGLRYHMLFESNRETFNRPEFRVHFGAHGTPFDAQGERLRFQLRLTSFAEDVAGKPAPTLAWLPFPGFGATPLLGLDRFLIDYSLENIFNVTLGRFPSPFAGSEVLFDSDYNFQGLSQSIRVDQALSENTRRWLPRFEIVGVQGYLAQNNVGLPAPTAEVQPVYIGGQLRFHLAPFESAVPLGEEEDATRVSSDPEWRLALGLHFYDGEEGIAPNLGVGLLDRTTNVLAEDGLVKSAFMLGEVYTELLLLRSLRSRLTTWFHGVMNFKAEPTHGKKGERNDFGFETGVSWGMERLNQRWDFRISFRYFIVEADALIPEFNDESLNTNTKGYEVGLHVKVYPFASLYGRFLLAEREDYELFGFGKPSNTDPNRSPGQILLGRIGVYMEF